MNVITPNPSMGPPPSGAHDNPMRTITVGETDPSFYDILLAVARYRRSVLCCTAGGLVIGVLIALLASRTYAFTSVIEIGMSTDQMGKPTPLESPESVIAKIATVIQPIVEREQGRSIGDSGYTFGLDLSNPRGTGLIVMTSKASDDREEEQQGMHRQVFERLKTSHAGIFSSALKVQSVELELAQQALEKVKKNAKTIDIRRKQMEERSALEKQRSDEIASELARMTARRDSLETTPTNVEQASAVSVLDVQIKRERDRRDERQRRQFADMAFELEQIIKDDEGNHRDQQKAEERLAAVQERIAAHTQTRMFEGVQRSQKPLGYKRSVSAMVGLAVGFVAGVSLAIFRNGLAAHLQICSQRQRAPL